MDQLNISCSIQPLPTRLNPLWASSGISTASAYRWNRQLKGANCSILRSFIQLTRYLSVVPILALLQQAFKLPTNLNKYLTKMSKRSLISPQSLLPSTTQVELAWSSSLSVSFLLLFALDLYALSTPSRSPFSDKVTWSKCSMHLNGISTSQL